MTSSSGSIFLKGYRQAVFVKTFKKESQKAKKKKIGIRDVNAKKKVDLVNPSVQVQLTESGLEIAMSPGLGNYCTGWRSKTSLI